MRFFVLLIRSIHLLQYYYGKHSFQKAAEFLNSDGYALVGYVLKNTLSDNGSVTRGICTLDHGRLTGIDETKDIVRVGNRIQSNGKMLDSESMVSMNFWCFPQEFIKILQTGFPEFLKTTECPEKDEYLLPIIADNLIKKGISFTVLPTDDAWFGVTYSEDKDRVIENYRKLNEDGVYQSDLYGDVYSEPSMVK